MNQSVGRAIYYTLKPFFPWRLRIGARRAFARRIQQKLDGRWPISEEAGVTPRDWPGWPEQKKFAFVITHDVEGSKGLAKCRKLAELEMEMGFRSSFNFIPEGQYEVTAELRHWLTENGFEVGVHDLHHNGWLFWSRDHFARCAKKINHYLKEWKAGGFRAGFMLHQLDWFHDLNVQYDASTFDVDPFEPQPDSAGTIFPFWISNVGKKINRDDESNEVSRAHPSGRSGYVELPYTLPQDSTLFFILQQKSPEIWLRKLDWVAGRGGMALVNVHPDYVRFDGERASQSTFSATYYRALLRRVAETYRGQYWNPRPVDLATWYKKTCVTISCNMTETATEIEQVSSDVTPPALRGKRAIVFLYSYYPIDPRPQRAAQALADAGMKVDVICLSESSRLEDEMIDGVRVIRLPLRKGRETKLTYAWCYAHFLLNCAARVSLLQLRGRYDLVHVHNMPDFLVAAALPAKVTGARVILDLHDPMPELMMSIYSLDFNQGFVRWLRRLERWSIAFADLVLTPNIAFKKLFVSRGCSPGKMQIMMNTPQEKIFDQRQYLPRPPVRAQSETFRIMHHGSLVRRHGVDFLVDAVTKVRAKIPNVRIDIYGSRNPYLDEVMDGVNAHGLTEVVCFHGAKQQSEIAEAIRQSDLGVIPNRRSSFTNINFPTRIFEFLSMGCPVIAPATEGIRDYFDDRQMLFFEPDNLEALVDRIIWVREHPVETDEILREGIAVYTKHLWKEEKSRYLNLVAGLFAKS